MKKNQTRKKRVTSSLLNKRPFKSPFPVVAIGASSGGLQAVTELLKNLSPKTGMAFIYVQHLDPNHKSSLTEILSRVTKMPVHKIEEWEKIQPDNVYVIPSDKEIKVVDGHIKLFSRANKKSGVTVDILFSSLAETHKENVIGIVLSGNGSDGTIGLRDIRNAGGLTFAQDGSTQFKGMAESAIAEGVVDFILSPKNIAQKINLHSGQDFIKHMSLKKNNQRTTYQSDLNENIIEPDLNAILDIIQRKKGVDFGEYKMSTIKRRIHRRMLMHKLTKLKQYIKVLNKDSNEVILLYNDLLINVTEFFREPETFKYLKNDLFPKLLKNEKKGETLRIWVTGCSTGQEAYSIAIILREILGNKFTEKQIQIFATDLSENAIKHAREGVYSQSEVKAISSKQLARFFTKSDGQYQINKSVRNMCAFATHDILSDPPFSKIDFISCCNMLIYLNGKAQKRTLGVFHYALNKGGYLMLGKSESTGTGSSLFMSTNKRFRIYSRKNSVKVLPRLLSGPTYSLLAKKEVALSKKKYIINDFSDLDGIVNSIFLSEFAPASVVINSDMTIVQFKGKISEFLQPSPGKATLNILKMAGPEIAFSLRNSIQRSITTKQPVRQDDIEMRRGSLLRLISLEVRPLNTEEEPLFLVIFNDKQVIETAENNIGPSGNNSVNKTRRIEKLEREISALRQEILSITAEYEKTIGDSQAINEEVVSANEELQGMIEEVETSKEEIESTNEELATTNQELNTRNEQLAEAYSFAENIISTLHEPILILDKNFSIRSANKAFYKVFMALESDTEGVSLFELGNRQWDIPDLHNLLEKIIPKSTYINNFEITHTFPSIGKKTFLLNARLFDQKVRSEQLILLAFTDISEKRNKQMIEKKELEDIIANRTSALKRGQDALTAKNVSLEKVNKELETFTYISSHDLQEPLRKIRIFANRLLEDEQSELSTSGKNYLERMNETVERMQKLIDDLLVYSQAKDTNGRFEKTDLSIIAQEVIGDFSELIKEKKAVVKINELCTATVIPFQFRLLLQNLLSNSLKFAVPDKRPIIIIKSKIAKGKTFKNDTLVPDNEYCHIVFSDNGKGFEPQYAERIFEVFQRLHEYDEFKGTGMGLAICKRIVENHNGVIKATGNLKKGARFDIIFLSGNRVKNSVNPR